MAKSKGSRSRSGRDDFTTSLTVPLSRPIAIRSPTQLTEIQDGRSWYPEDFRPALDIAGRPHTLQYPSPKKTRLNRDRFARLRAFPSSRVQFANSERVLVCVRRKTRKEVLFAKRKTGYGKKRRSPRRSRYSSISC